MKTDKLSKLQRDELNHIYDNQPVHAGDTLCGGEVVASLRRMNLIESDGEGNYYTTPLGNNEILTNRTNDTGATERD